MNTRNLTDLELRKVINRFLATDPAGRIIDPWLEDAEYLAEVRAARADRLAVTEREKAGALATLRARMPTARRTKTRETAPSTATPSAARETALLFLS